MATLTTNLAHFQDELYEAITLTTRSITAPLREIHMFKDIPGGSNNVQVAFPTAASGVPTFTAVTDGTLYTTRQSYPVSEVQVKPLVYENQTVVLENNLYYDDGTWFNYVRDSLARGAAKTMVGILTDLYDDLDEITTASSGALTVGAFADAVQYLAAKDIANEQMVAHLSHKSYQQLVESAGSTFISAPAGLGEMPARTGYMGELYGVRIFKSSHIGIDTGNYENFVGTRQCIGMAYGIQPQIKLLELDGSHIVVSMSFAFAAGTVDSTQGVELKAGS